MFRPWPPAVALIQPFAWEPAFAKGAALKKKKEFRNASHSSFAFEEIEILSSEVANLGRERSQIFLFFFFFRFFCRSLLKNQC